MSSDARDLGAVFRGIPKFTAAVGAAVAALSPFLLPDRLIPGQLDALRPLTSLLIFVGIIIGWVYRSRLRDLVGMLSLVAAAALLVLVVLQLVFVVRVDAYGEPPATEYFLIGYEHTPVGVEMLERVGALQLPVAEQIRRAGDDNIPVLFGSSYRIAALAYVLTVIAFVLCATMAVAVAEVELARAPQRADAAPVVAEEN